ncbi:MAG: putative peptidoglycan glycosyltransferase FtsW [Bryobacteraceae bacterium]|jgi:cell division protein FtsW
MARFIKTDWVLFGTIVALVCFGLVMVYSSSSVMAEVKLKVTSVHFLVRQLGFAIASFFLLMYFKRQDYRLMKNPVWAFTGLGAVLILQVAVFFADTRAHRWFRIAGVSLQPSEFAKPALIVFLAYFVCLRLRAINERHTIRPVALALAVVGVTVGMGDLGTAIVLVVPAAILFYVAGLERRYVVAAALIGVLACTAFVISKPYRLARVIGKLDPDYTLLDRFDPKGGIKQYMNESITTRDTGYQARQSRIAVGSGGPFGVGLMNGRQKILFLPEAHTDFIYAVVGEELGLWGCTAVLAGFLVILWRGFRLFWIAPDDFGRYLALGVTSSIVVQALINMSVVLDMGPTKGIPLPMISSGGSSLLSTLMCLGMLMSVSGRSE